MSDTPTVASSPNWVAEPAVLVFDVNETLIDIESMNPLFTQIFSNPHALREWFANLVMYSMTTTLSANYVDFFTLGQGVLRMLADIHDVQLSDSDVEDLGTAMLSMPAHPDVAPGLELLREAGFRLVTLTNSPASPGRRSSLEQAGLADFFERKFTIDTMRTYKPAPLVYHYVSQELDVAPSSCLMVAAHVWDTLGAQSAGYTAALITRPGNAPLPIRALPQPTVLAADLPDLARQLIARWRC
ncbi:MAG: hdl IVa [Frankiales bacterium]|nr:hdl IVa [Frankiales bacterium]